MQHQVIVSFGKNQQFEYRFSLGTLDSKSAEAARHWFDREFQSLGCEVNSPTGKILMIDRILSVAKYAGEKQFEQQQQWADEFARYTAALLGRDLIRVDVPSYVIGY